MIDYEDSMMVLNGTPPRVPKTFFEGMWNSPAFKRYTWSVLDNPHIPNPEEFVREMAAKRGLSLDAPFIQREYYGVMGSYDIEAMVYKVRRYHAKD
jgi:hypothetical protein